MGEDVTSNISQSDGCLDAIYQCDTDGNVVFVWRRSKAKLPSWFAEPGDHISNAFKCPADAEEFKFYFSNAAKERSNNTLSCFQFACDLNGSPLNLEFTLARLPSFDYQIFVTVSDVSLRNKADYFARRQREILETIAANAPLNEILDQVTRLLEEQLPGAFSSILLLENSSVLRHGAAPSLPPEYCHAIDGTIIGPFVGSCGTAAYCKETVVVRDIATDPLWADYKHIALAHGLQSCWSTPLHGPQEDVLGTFAVYYPEPHVPSPHEIEIVASVTHLAGLAISHQQTRDAYQKSESRFLSVLESSQDANYRWQLADGTIEYISPAITKITGYTIPEFVSFGVDGLRTRLHPDDLPVVRKVIAAVASGEIAYGDVQYRFLHKRGHYCWINDRFTALREKDATSLYWVGSLKDISLSKRAEESLQASNARYDKQHRALTALTRGQVLQTANLKETLKEITETVAQVLDVDRVSIWRFGPGQKSIVCHELYELARNVHSSGAQLMQEDYPSYFQAMATTNLISADDAWTDPRTTEFTETYLKPLGIRSMLDSPIQLAGALEGVLCLEHVGEPRSWRYDEQTFVVSVANLVSLILSKWEISRAEEAIRVSQKNLANAQRIAHLGSWTWNLETDYQEWSEEVYNLLGYKSSEISPHHEMFLCRVHPEDVSIVTSIIERTLAQGFKYDVEYRIIRPDMSELVIQEQAEIERNSEGKPLKLAGTILDITQRKHAEQQLLYEALHDGLTGLGNRTLVAEHLSTSFQRFQRDNTRRFALIMADLDRFKNVNDTLGHQVGDKVLIETARRIKAATREEDTVARIGGDEFAVLLDEINEEETPTRVAHRIITAMEQPLVIDGRIVDIGISVGVVVPTSSHLSTEDLFRDADIALYRAKGAGRGSYQVFDLDMHRRILDRLQIEADLRHALERNEMMLYLQPVVSLSTGAIESFEALLRWKHPVRGFVSPAVFIPIAEESKLIIPIGQWVTEQACQILKNWPTAVKPSISINASPVQITAAPSNPALSSASVSWDNSVISAAAETGIPPSLLGIEITEGVLIGDQSSTREILENLVRQGFRLLLDDFGTGYSSLSYLEELPFHKVKLDSGFTAKLKPAMRSYDLLSGIISLAHNIGLSIVAEGVETEEQLALLRQAGCDFAQGYFISFPLPVEDAIRLYQSGRTW